MNVAKIDRNFAVQTSLNLDDVKFYNIEEAPFTVYGVFREDGCYRRLPDAVAQTVSEGVAHACKMTSGGRIKFKTNSAYVAIQMKTPAVGKMAQFALTGSAGFDLYVGKKEEYYGVFIPPRDITDSYESVLRFPDSTMREITINFPLFSLVSDVYIGLEETAVVKKTAGYKHTKPIVFYGNSVTQGGCAQRPGNAYVNRACRELNRDYLNLGMWGSAKGQPELAEYIAMLSMEACVLDYDGNQRKPEGLAATHYPFYDIIRQKHPKIPILMLTRSSNSIGPETALEMKKIIWETFQKACSNGDENAHFLDGEVFFGYDSAFFADRVHPNDRGHEKAGCLLVSVLKRIFSGEKNVCVLQRPISCE